MLGSGHAPDTISIEDTSTFGRTIMRLVLATIVAAATLTLATTPALADGERGRGHYDNGRGGERGDDRRDNRRDYRQDNRFDNRHDNRRDNRDDYRRHDNRGATYWGPSARSWSRWDNSWGDPHRYARQWGFDRYDYNRGWQRGNTWYSSPSAWSDWGGWNWSFSVSNGGFNNYNSYSNNNCAIYRTEDWINGRRAVVSYTGCSDRYGRVYEQPNTRRIERWVW